MQNPERIMIHSYDYTETNAQLIHQLERNDQLLQQLQADVEGTIFLHGDPGYDQARSAWNLTVDQRPALIVDATGANDIAAAVRYARYTGLGIAVQSTGHGVARPADDALLILTRQMKDVRINAAAQTAWVDAGAHWGDVLAPAQQVGLAPLLGSSPGVGVIGYTLGGGMGWLARRYGMALDSVLAFEVVMPDGRRLRADASENAELFWGMRGGGGGFAIVTAIQIKLYPVTTVYGGNLFYPAALGREVMVRYRDWVATLPDAMTSSLVLMNYPPIPAVPETLRGQTMILVRGCFAGEIEEGERLLEYWRTWRAPQIDAWRALAFSQVATISNDPVAPMPAKSTGAWLHSLSDDAIDALLRYGTPQPAQQGPLPLVFTELRHAGGAIARADPASAAFCHRDGLFNLLFMGLTPTAEAMAGYMAYTAAIKAQLQQDLTGGVYLNFLEGEEARERTRAAFTPEVHQRLAVLKAAVDPDNRLAYSFDIRPDAVLAQEFQP
jgi:FAD/FMN-containing dehydrogenase